MESPWRTIQLFISAQAAGVFEVEVDEVGPSLRNATAKIAKTSRAGGAPAGGSNGGGNGGGNDDPWASSAPAGWGASVGSMEEPPF